MKLEVPEEEVVDLATGLKEGQSLVLEPNQWLRLDLALDSRRTESATVPAA